MTTGERYAWIMLGWTLILLGIIDAVRGFRLLTALAGLLMSGLVIS